MNIILGHMLLFIYGVDLLKHSCCRVEASNNFFPMLLLLEANSEHVAHL